jgi:cytolysin (calcineurin-like family phosphatase)
MTGLILVPKEGDRSALKDSGNDSGEEPTGDRGGGAPNGDPKGVVWPKDAIKEGENREFNQREGTSVGQLKIEPKLDI